MGCGLAVLASALAPLRTSTIAIVRYPILCARAFSECKLINLKANCVSQPAIHRSLKAHTR
eukprot:6195418-Pleurochrysis_carterae.AAC.2